MSWQANNVGGPNYNADETEIEGSTGLQGVTEETMFIFTGKRYKSEYHVLDTSDANEIWF